MHILSRKLKIRMWCGIIFLVDVSKPASRKETESTKPHQDIDMHFNQEKDVDLGLEVYYKQIRIYTDILMWK